MQVLFTEIDRFQQVAIRPKKYEIEGEELTQEICNKVMRLVFEEDLPESTFTIDGPIAYLWCEEVDYQLIKL